jgi:outer membrane protein assembly factor BamB
VKKILGFLSILLLCSIMSALYGADWPQFRGPQRDGVSRETNLRKQWPDGGPPLLWTYANLGVGYSGPAVVGDRLYTSAARGDSEYVFALDLKNAGDQGVKEVWSTRIGPLFSWKGNNWNAGPSATPTVDGELLYALGGNGDLVCVEVGSGKERWRKNLPRELGGEVNPIGGGQEEPTPLGWGYAWAPLVDGQQLVCVPGGKQGLLAALDKMTGQVLWQSKEVTNQATYSSPIAVEIAGARQYVQVTNEGIVGVAAKDGKKLWSYMREPAYGDVVIATPVFLDNHLFATVGFAQGCDLIKLTSQNSAFQVEKVFSNKTVENRDGGVVLVDGHVYGYSENKGWFCMELKTGAIAWSERNKLGRGSLTYADGNLYCCTEQGGIVALVEATPKGWNEKGRLQLPKESRQRKQSGGLWTHPVVANGRLYLRDQELLFCYDLKP